MTIIDINLLLGLALARIKHSNLPTWRSVRTESLTNNVLVVYGAFNKGSCNERRWKRLYRSRGYRARKLGVENYIKNKWRVDIEDLDSIWLDDSKIVYIVISIAINDKFSLLQFMNAFFYLFAPLIPNTTNRFKLIDVSQLSI